MREIRLPGSMSGVWRRGMVEMVGHPRRKGGLTGENKLRPKLPRHTSTLRRSRPPTPRFEGVLLRSAPDCPPRPSRPHSPIPEPRGRPARGRPGRAARVPIVARVVRRPGSPRRTGQAADTPTIAPRPTPRGAAGAATAATTNSGRRTRPGGDAGRSGAKLVSVHFSRKMN